MAVTVQARPRAVALPFGTSTHCQACHCFVRLPTVFSPLLAASLPSLLRCSKNKTVRFARCSRPAEAAVAWDLAAMWRASQVTGLLLQPPPPKKKNN